MRGTPQRVQERYNTANNERSPANDERYAASYYFDYARYTLQMMSITRDTFSVSNDSSLS